MGNSFSDYIRGFAFLAWLNLKHYVLALWGIRLRLDPDYPMEWRVFPGLMSDSVLEYRLYGLFAPWCVFLALALPSLPAGMLAGFWAVLAWKRAGFYSSALAFWRQAYRESPNKNRVRIRLAEEIAFEIERLDKAGEDWISDRIQSLVVEGTNLQELITKGKQ